MAPNAFYVALGIEENEPGYNAGKTAVESLGTTQQLSRSLWHLGTRHSLIDAFYRINNSMLDRRIASHAGLLILNPVTHHAKWYLEPFVSHVIQSQWDIRNNIFLSFNLEESPRKKQRILSVIHTLGTVAPIATSTWYLSSLHTTKEVFRALHTVLQRGDQLCLFDSTGTIAIWQGDLEQKPSLPASITIHAMRAV